MPELIPVLGSQPAGDVSHKPSASEVTTLWRYTNLFIIIIKEVTQKNPTVGCHYFPPGLQLPPQPLRGLLPILLLGEQRHDGCEQFA